MSIFDKDYRNPLCEDTSKKKEGIKADPKSENKQADLTEIKKVDFQKTEQHKEDAEKLKEYKSGLIAYQEHSKKRENLQARVKTARKNKEDYEKVWANAIFNAQSVWKSKQSEQSRKEDIQKKAMRIRAESEKTGRLKEVDAAEKEIRHRLSDNDRMTKETEQLISDFKARISKLKHYEMEGFECDPRAERLILQAFNNGYLSKKQKLLAAETPQQYCSVWAQTPQKLKSLEESFLETGFLHDLSNISSNEKIYGIVVNMAGLIAGLICFFLITLNQLSKNVIFNALGMIAAYLASAGSGYLNAAVVAKFLKKHKKVAVHNSKSGVIAIILSILFAFPMMKITYDFAIFNRGFGGFRPGIGLSIGLIGGIIIWAVLKQSFMRDLLMSKSTFIRGETYKALFRKASATTNQRRSDAGQPLLADGEMDAMIVSYVHHHKYLQYLSLSKKKQLIAEAKSKLEAAEKVRQDAARNREEIMKLLAKIKAHRDEVVRLNQETDRKLDNELRDFDRLHGTKAAPDFSMRSNLLDKDREILSTAERGFGIPANYTQNRDMAVKACREVFENLRRNLQEAKEQEEKDILTIQKWTESGILPPFNYMLEPMVCLFNKSVPTERKVTIINHEYRPINFIYDDGDWIPGNELSTENAAFLIGMLWQGFSRIAPPELLNLYIVDDTCRLRFSFPGKICQFIPEFQHQIGTAEVLEQRNTQNRFRPLKGIYTDQDIQELTKIIAGKYQEIEDYIQVNRREIQAAADRTNVQDIEAVNYCMSHGKTHSVKPYDIVIFVVPEGEENRNTYQSMNTIVQVIQQGAAKRIGFIPVVLAPKSGYNSKWSSFVDLARRSGINYHVDLKTLHLNKIERG